MGVTSKLISALRGKSERHQPHDPFSDPPGVQMETKDGKNFYQKVSTIKPNSADRAAGVHRAPPPEASDPFMTPFLDQYGNRDPAIEAIHGPRPIPPAISGPNDPRYIEDQRINRMMANRGNSDWKGDGE